MSIQMVDLQKQYQRIKSEIDTSIQDVIDSTAFIKGPAVKTFEKNLAQYLGVRHVIGCGNGTDALQIALMALDLKPLDEVIVPDFTFIASAEVIALLGLTPVFVAVDPHTFNMDMEQLEACITSKTKAIIPVHLFGQCVDMEALMEFALKYNLAVVEDNAQAIGAQYLFKDGSIKKAGAIGAIGTTSFFPSKNLGCYGDGGAIFTNDDLLANKMRALANHGMEVRYYHKYIGINSRLDSVQAAVLNVKLPHLEDFNRRRSQAALFYNEGFKDLPQVKTPMQSTFSTHVFHQYTLKVEQRDALKLYLEKAGIPAMVYYPVPLHAQEAFNSASHKPLQSTIELSKKVLSLPMHTELTIEEQDFIVRTIKAFYEQG